MTSADHDSDAESVEPTDSESSAAGDRLDRLERAVDAWLEHADDPSSEVDTVIRNQPPEVRDLLRSMLSGEAEGNDGRQPDAVARISGFELVREVGRGGMGVVYEARDPRLERTVALKVVSARDLDADATRSRFGREAAAAARLAHPGICQVYGSGEDGDRLWIAMELLGGGSLADRMRPEPRPGAAEPEGGLPGEAADGRTVAAVRLVAELADAVDFAHRHAVIHRDIKPQNILFDAQDRPRLVDFGVAKLLDRVALSRTGDFAGSLAYASPEQIAGARSVDGGTDIWSLGVVAYELMFGRRPFAGESHESLIRGILGREPEFPKIAVDLRTILACALEKERVHRYATAAEFGEDLRRFLRHEPIAAAPPSTVSRVGALLATP